MKEKCSIGVIFILSFQILISQNIQKTFYEIQREYELYYSEHPKRGGAYKQWKRAEYYLESRTGPAGEILHTEELKWQAWQSNQRRMKRYPQRGYSGNWTFFGPFLIEENKGIGRVNKIAFHPTDTNILYAATAGGGLQFTNNHGANWAPLTESLPVNNLSGIVVDYADPQNIYILTGDGDGCCGGARSYYLRKSSMGVLKSTNSGVTWEATGLIFDETDMIWPYDLVQHPQFPEILYVASSEGVFLTLNAGETWTTTLQERIYEIHIKPDQPTHVFAVSKDSLYRSTTTGLTWSAIPIPPLDSVTGRMSMTICAQDPNIMYLVASPESEDTTSFRGLFRSEDGGFSFEFVIDSPNIVDYQPNYDLTLMCNPWNTDEVLVGAVRHWKSTDAGATFQSVSGTHADVHDLQFNPAMNRLYSATDGGLYYTDDFGDSWTFMSEYCGITQYYKMAVSQQDHQVVIAGAQDNGTHRNHELATEDMDKIFGGDGMDCAIHPLNDSLMIVSSQNGDFSISRDRGETVDSLLYLSSLPTTVTAPWVTPVAWDPNDTSVIFLGYDPIYRSFDGGSTFDPIPDTLSGGRILHVAPANSNRLYAGDRYTLSNEDRVFHLWTSVNQGDSWTPLHTMPTFPDTFLVVTGLCTHPLDETEVWLTMSGYIQGQKVYRSTDGGLTWMNMSGSLPNTQMNTIILEESIGSGNYAVYVGTDIGVFYTDQSLGDWVSFSNGLPVIEVADLELNQDQGKILACTHGRGIWMADVFSSCETVIHVSSTLQANDHSYFFQASDSIISTIPVDNSFGVRVIYKSGEVIRLLPGFRATQQNGAYFRALRGDCDTGGIYHRTIPTTGLVPNLPFAISSLKNMRKP